MKIRAAVLETMGLPAPYAESRPLKIREVEIDPPGHGEVRVRVLAAGLCHSDLSVINGDRPRPMPMALGHEAAGIVEELGAGVTAGDGGARRARPGRHAGKPGRQPVDTRVRRCGLCAVGTALVVAIAVHA